MDDIKIFQDNIVTLEPYEDRWIVTAKYTQGLCFSSASHSTAKEVYEMLVRQYIKLTERNKKLIKESE